MTSLGIQTLPVPKRRTTVSITEVERFWLDFRGFCLLNNCLWLCGLVKGVYDKNVNTFFLSCASKKRPYHISTYCVFDLILDRRLMPDDDKIPLPLSSFRSPPTPPELSISAHSHMHPPPHMCPFFIQKARTLLLSNKRPYGCPITAHSRYPIGALLNLCQM